MFLLVSCLFKHSNPSHRHILEQDFMKLGNYSIKLTANPKSVLKVVLLKPIFQYKPEELKNYNFNVSKGSQIKGHVEHKNIDL